MEIICYSCGSGENPENTIEGIRHCQQVNANWRIEMDIQMTSDHELVLFHDYNTKRTTGEDLMIYNLTLQEVKQLNAGHNFQKKGEFTHRSSTVAIPELRTVFTIFPKAKLLLDVHTKDPRVVEILVQLVEEAFHQGDFIIVSEYDEIIQALKVRKPHWQYGVPKNEAKRMLYSSFVYLDGLFPIKSDVLMLPEKYGAINVLSKRVINHAQKRGKKIWAWKYEGDYVQTINTKFEMDTLARQGIDGIFTEFPEKLAKDLSG